MGKWSRETWIKHATEDVLSTLNDWFDYAEVYKDEDDLISQCLDSACYKLQEHGFLPIIFEDDENMVQNIVKEKVRDLEEWREFYRMHGFGGM